MKLLFWVLVIAAAAGFAYWLRSWRRRQEEREQAAEQRLAEFMVQARAQVAPGSPVAPADPAQKLLFEAAGKAGEANEPALAIQLYARLLSRFPNGAFAAQARTAVESQKRKLAKP